MVIAQSFNYINWAEAHPLYDVRFGKARDAIFKIQHNLLRNYRILKLGLSACPYTQPELVEVWPIVRAWISLYFFKRHVGFPKLVFWGNVDNRVKAMLAVTHIPFVCYDKRALWARYFDIPVDMYTDEEFELFRAYRRFEKEFAGLDDLIQNHWAWGPIFDVPLISN